MGGILPGSSVIVLGDVNHASMNDLPEIRKKQKKTHEMKRTYNK